MKKSNTAVQSDSPSADGNGIAAVPDAALTAIDQQIEDAGGQFSGLAQFFFDHVPGFNAHNFEAVAAKYREMGFWAIFAGGFTPLPYKVFTITAGIVKLSLPTFFVASLISRAARFFLVGGLFFFFGTPIKAFIDRYLGWLTVAFVALLAVSFYVLKFLV